MSNSSISVTPGSGTSVNGFTTPDGDFNQAVVLIDPTTGKTASVLDNGAGFESLNVSGTYKEFASLSAGALNADLLVQTDVSGYKSGTVDVRGSWIGTIIVQVSNDGTNYSSLANNIPQGNNVPGNNITGNNLYEFSLPTCRYLRIRMTSYTSGTATGTVELSTLPAALHAVTAQVSSTSFTGSGVPSSAFYEGNIARATSPTATSSGNMVGALADLFGTRMISSGGLQTTAVAAGTAGNTVIKASSGRICRVLVTATGTNAMSIYDNATTNSGTIIGAIPANPTVGTTYDFNLPAATGITVGGNASNPGVTIGWI